MPMIAEERGDFGSIDAAGADGSASARGGPHEKYGSRCGEGVDGGGPARLVLLRYSVQAAIVEQERDAAGVAAVGVNGRRVGDIGDPRCDLRRRVAAAGGGDRLGGVIHGGDRPAMQGEVACLLPGAAAQINGPAGWQSRFSLNEGDQWCRYRGLIPWCDVQALEHPVGVAHRGFPRPWPGGHCAAVVVGADGTTAARR